MGTRPDLLLGIDAGTSVVKAALFSRQGEELAVVRRPTTSLTPRPRWSEASMSETWEQTADAIRALLGSAGIDGERVAAIGLTGNMVGAWLIDEDGRPLRNAILWNDGRSQPLIDQLGVEHPGLMQTIYRTSGSVMQQGCTLPLLRWLLDNEPTVLDQAAAVLCCKDWIGYKLTNAYQVDPTEASVMPGDARTRGYSDAMLRLFGLDSCRHLFPAVRPSEAIAGRVHAEAHAQTGLPLGIPVVVGAGDVPASAIGLGAVEPGVACTLLGTNILNCLVTAEAVFEPPDVGLLFCLPGGSWLRATANVSGTTSLDWFIAQFCAAEVNAATSQADLFLRLEAMAKSSPVGADGVLYLPYLSALGITSPFLEPAARAEFFGLTDRHTRGDLLRAVYEGIALSIRDGYAMLPAAVDEIRLSGGGAKSALWSRIIADCTGRAVVIPQGSEFGARGAALLAAVGIGWYGSVQQAVQQTSGRVHTYMPDPAARAVYDRQFEVYRMLQHDLRPAWQKAAARL